MERFVNWIWKLLKVQVISSNKSKCSLTAVLYYTDSAFCKKSLKYKNPPVSLRHVKSLSEYCITAYRCCKICSTLTKKNYVDVWTNIPRLWNHQCRASSHGSASLSLWASTAYLDETLAPSPWVGHTQAFGLESLLQNEQVGWGGERDLQECMSTFGPAATVEVVEQEKQQDSSRLLGLKPSKLGY